MSRTDQIYQHDLSSINQCQEHLGPEVKLSECIRLLRVIDEDSDEAHANSILVELQTTTRSTCPAYIAVSYAWSLDPPTSTIRFMHCLQTMSVPSDLLAAMVALGNIYPGAWFWLDAISIDQANLAEKSVQVAGMGRTYKQAEKTVVWLGQDFVNDVAASTRSGVQGSTSIRGLTVTTLRNLARRSARVWWRRTWVVQEMVLARDMEVVVGAQAISWTDFVSSFMTVYDMTRKDRSVFVATEIACTDSHSDPLLARGVKNILELNSVRAYYRNRSDKISSLNFLLLYTSRTHCNDPRDKIYALLGLATDFDRSSITVDYTLSTAQVFTSVASPSDVAALQRGVFTCNERAIAAWDDVKPHELHLEGLVFDQVEGTFYTRKEDLESFPHGKVMGLDELLRHIPLILRRDSPPSESRHHIDRSAAFWSTGLLHEPAEGYTDDSELPSPPAVHELVASPPCAPIHPGDDAKEPPSYTAEDCREFERTTSGAALFTTALGFFGPDPTFMRPGDCVAVLFGGKTPFVLRPTGKPGDYTFVGHSYVHGIMNGELIKLLDQGLLETEWFVLV
ncbi:hypothetical protein LTR17_022980 [Elasticomyces elasticus]|nr:hypothetical protein LTR17_022980 [Elasticomyces elasticus]